jgi:GNAT superfamily N-acetyltransferase
MKRTTARRRTPKFRALPLTPERWQDFTHLFGTRGACGGCWCMWHRLTRAEFEKRKGAGNRRAMKRLVDAGPPPGLLGYLGEEPIAWCAIGERDAFPSLDRSRLFQPVDDQRVWSIVCLFIAKEHRQQGISVRMIKEALRYARSGGARIVEAYAVEPKKAEMPAVFAYPGLATAYRRAGFREVARRSPTRPILRKRLRPR